jgi:hypothetical protein
MDENIPRFSKNQYLFIQYICWLFYFVSGRKRIQTSLATKIAQLGGIEHVQYFTVNSHIYEYVIKLQYDECLSSIQKEKQTYPRKWTQMCLVNKYINVFINK